MTTQKIELNVIPEGIQPIIHVSQYDKGQTWLFYLYDNDTPYTIPVGASITIQGTKQDGTGFQYACTFSGSVVTAEEKQQMTVFAGDVQTELVITSSGQQLATLNFIIRVEPAALRDDTQMSETELPLIEQAAELVQMVPVIEGYAEDAEAYAIGTRNGEPVSSDDPAYENNAKYYAENFIGQVTDAQYSAIQSLLA